MPFINGRYYMNPQYGAGTERARGFNGDLLDEILKSLERSWMGPAQEQEPPELREMPHPSEVLPIRAAAPQDQLYAQASSQRSGSAAQNAADGHWVTMNHRHVFIQESQSGDHEQHRPPGNKALPPSGEASIYSDIFEGERTSNGEIFRQNGYTAALLPRSRWHAVPLGTRVELTHDGRSVVVEINDRGAGDRKPDSNRAIDLPRAAASALGGHDIKDDQDAKSIGVIHLNSISVVPKETPLGPVKH